MGATGTGYPPIFDGHNDTVNRLKRSGESFFERGGGHLDLPRAVEGGLGGGFCAVYVRDPQPAGSAPAAPAGDPFSPQALERILAAYADEKNWPAPMPADYARSEAVDQLGRLLRVAGESDGKVEVVRTAADIERCLANGVFAMLLHFEGADQLDDEGYALETFWAAGVRSVGLTHARRNRFATGAPFKFPGPPDLGPGLTDQGKNLVRQLNRRRVVVDVSHLNEKGFWDVAAITDAPIVATHSNAHAVSPAARALTDRQLDAIKESRGIAGLNFHVGMLTPDCQHDPNTPISMMVDMIDYMVGRLGVDGVGFGSDFDGSIVPVELGDAAGLPKCMRALEARGYGPAELHKLAHGNWVRVLRETWGA